MGANNRQIQRSVRIVSNSQQKILEAFRQLVLDRSYDDVSVIDVVSLAGVGRSTFYDHFPDKRSLLLVSVNWLLEIMVRCATGQGDESEAMDLVLHLDENRDIGRLLLNSSSSVLISRSLTEKLMETGQFSSIESVAVANQYVGVMRSWLSDELRVGNAELSSWLVNTDGH